MGYLTDLMSHHTCSPGILGGTDKRRLTVSVTVKSQYPKFKPADSLPDFQIYHFLPFQMIPVHVTANKFFFFIDI